MYKVGLLACGKARENAKNQFLLCMGGFSGKVGIVGVYEGVLDSTCGRSCPWLVTRIL